jgi:hypothetical protein
VFNWKPVIWTFFLLWLLERKLEMKTKCNENLCDIWHAQPLSTKWRGMSSALIELLFNGSLCWEIADPTEFDYVLSLWWSNIWWTHTVHEFLLAFTLVRKQTLLSFSYIVHCFLNPKDKIEALKFPYLWRIKWKPCFLRYKMEKSQWCCLIICDDKFLWHKFSYPALYLPSFFSTTKAHLLI